MLITNYEFEIQTSLLKTERETAPLILLYFEDRNSLLPSA